jgi:thymidylate synthase ThyX
MHRYNDNFSFSLSKESETDLLIVSLKDDRTGVVVRTALSNPGKQTPSIMAFAGARFSRSSDTTEDIFKEIKASGKNAQEKLASIFRNYGHASVADMSQLFGYIENISQLNAMKFFYETSIGGGQERSTRYQDFSTSNYLELENYIHEKRGVITSQDEYLELNRRFKELQKYSLDYYNKWVEILTKKYAEEYQVDLENKKEKSALVARVFDSSRYFLLNGISNKTSLGWITSAREWARIISTFKSSNVLELQYLGEQLEILFAPETDFAKKIEYLPEAPDLIRYTSADETTVTNLLELKNFLNRLSFEKFAKFNDTFDFKKNDVEAIDLTFTSGTKSIAQYINTLYPNMNEIWLLNWLNDLEETYKIELGKIVFKNFNHHKQLGNQGRVNSNTFLLTCSFAEARDLNRHRAWGRFSSFLSCQQKYKDLIYEGYTLPLYLSQNNNLKDEKKEFEFDLQGYYRKLLHFIDLADQADWFPKYLYLEMLPFAHILKLWMHASPKEISYMTKLRVRPGGHINYRFLAWKIAKLAGNSEPFLNHLGDTIGQAPDPSSREEFLDRS